MGEPVTLSVPPSSRFLLLFLESRIGNIDSLHVNRYCMSVVFPSFLLTFSPSFTQQTFIYLSRTGCVVGTELAAEALFAMLRSYLGPWLSKRSSYPFQYSLVMSAEVKQHWVAVGDTEDTLFIDHLLYARPRRHHHPPSHGLESHNTSYRR